jgi:alcohol dehydrogenase
MQSFQSYLPTRLDFGNDHLKNLGDDVKQLGKRALIVTYPIDSLGDIVQQAVDLLKKSGIDAVIFAEVESNPPYTLVNRGGKLAREQGCDFVIGLGGGSAMDTAKGISVVATEEVDIWKIYEGAPITKPTLPIVAVPTTAGTGSEATFFTVISHPGLQRKEGFARAQFFPTLSIVDPVLTLGLPPRITAETGLDALSHAIEAYYCRLSTPIVDALAKDAIRLIAQNLRRAVYDGSDLTARYNMLLANTLAGMAITQSDSCLAHVIGEAVGGVFNTGHGLTIALCLPATMEYNCMTVPEKFAEIAALMGENTTGLTTRELAQKAPSAVRNLIQDLSLPLGMQAIGVKESEKVKELINRPGMDASSPRPVDRAGFDLLFKACMDPGMSYWDLGGV